MKRYIRFTLLLIITIIGIWYTPDRYIQHLLCAIVIPQIYIELDKHSITIIGYIVYLIDCFVWEFYQYIERGFLQIDQLTFDVSGIVLSYIIFEIVIVENSLR